MSHHLADVYRQRARNLRRLAATMADTPAMTLRMFADEQTWRGPRALACTSDLQRAEWEIHREIDSLHTRAWRFDREADRLDAQAAAAAASGAA